MFLYMNPLSHDNCTNYEQKLFCNTFDNSLITAAAVTCKRLVSMSSFVVIASVSAIRGVY